MSASKPDLLLPTPDQQLLNGQKNALLAAIINASDDTIISKTLQGIVTSWNPAAVRMFGYTEAEILGKHISIIIPPDRLNEEAFIIGQVVKGKQINHFETIRVAKNGDLIPISLTVSPVYNDAGEIIGASKIARDISDRKKAVEKQGVLAAIVDSSDDTILSKTLEGIITSWNKAAERMFGYSEAEAIGKHISLIIPPERLNEEAFIIGEVSKGNKVNHFHTYRRAKDGTLIPLSVSVSPVMDDEGRIIGASKIARDITEQHQLQEEKERVLEKLKELNNRKDEFIGLASHELKTPLTSLSGYLQILSRSVSDERSIQFVAKAMKQMQKLNSLVTDLLDVSKIETGKLPLIIESFDICQTIKDTIELIALNNSRHQIIFETELSDVIISGDPQRIEQVIINLLTNAIRYAPESKRIEVSLSRDEKNVKIGVKDFGLGISPDNVHDIFSRFYRVDENNPNVSGLGIGLFLSKEIINRHNGEIWVDSEPGKGSTFWFTLPV